MRVFTRKVRFEEIDAAQIVFFAHYYSYAHEAMEHFFDGLAGGYVEYTQVRALCFSTVKLDSTFQSPLRYGDSVAIEITTKHLGNRSATLRYRFVRDNSQTALFEHTIVSMDFRDKNAIKSCAMPADVRALFSEHAVG